MTTVGQRIKATRKEKGLPQVALTGPGVSDAHISRIEAGLRNPSVKAIRKIAAKLGVDPTWLEHGCRSFTFVFVPDLQGAIWLEAAACDVGNDLSRAVEILVNRPVEIRVTETMPA